ncbi:hypothetical protein BV22DRAFT_1196306 [Leucogyrophana mollusca]|uniref:Uncharacterized protein n=1 Tax=Leucogyrophana mollusca TaxID=85980 RepID=A0ACB8BHG2_9AGAM|nr:hypothetical protein BV22DRAFT_1196306 [Leucogyrophana mollusca]
MSSSLKAVFDLLKSDKIKERQEGVASLRTAFARDHAVRNLDEKRDGRAWLIVFQALFTSVIKEKEACTKKAASGKSATTGAAALRRLGEAAATVRWLTERSVRELSKKTLKPLLAHCLQTMIYRGELYTPVALDYIKTIRCLLSWTPHMDHLDENNWLKIVEMAFNVILDDPVRRSFEDGEETGEGGGESMQVDDSDMYQDDSEDEEDTDNNLPSTSTQTRKRRRREVSATPAPSGGRTTISSRQNAQRVVSLEQIELTSLLALLLRSPCAPLLSPNVPNLSSAILTRMRRFLVLYPADTSLHHDFLLALQATLSHVALNRKSDVETFARGAWDGLVKLWGTKNKRMKESLLGVLRVLFPFLTADQDGTSYAWADGVQKIWHLLNGEAESRWGIDGLSLDSLRLEVVSPDDEDICEREPFVARTFRAGWHFDPNQALAWAVLDLQADCAAKLFEHSESVHSSTPEFGPNKGKRVKREDPITFLLQSIQNTLASNVRACHLQVLLFFIDRHWHRLHDTLQQGVINTLLQFISVDDATIQSWTFLCFAAIARSDRTQASTTTLCQGDISRELAIRGPTTWDPIWTHAMRRANVPVVCRAACHTAYTLVSHAKQLLTSQRVLVEIETLAKDLDLQGPTFAYDSVCMFLSQCLRVASQDVRLYRMQLEEKVLSWLLENWRVGPAQSTRDGSGMSRMPLHTIADILNLLENICGSSKRSDLVCRVLLPECSIVDVMVDERRTRVIRDFLLFARLPSFQKVDAQTGARADSAHQSPPVLIHDGRVDQELLQPQGRERRVSSSLLKSLEGLVLEWEAMRESSAHPTAEKARQSLDTAITALAFESLLVWNGTRSNRRVLQCASKLITLVTPLMTASKWTMEERVLILHALEPLISNGEEDASDEWDAMLPPDIGTGIKTQTLRALKLDAEKRRYSHILRRQFQRVFWGNTDIQDVFGVVSSAIREALRTLTGQTSHDPHAADGADDKDGFGPIRTTRATLQTPEENQDQEHNRASRYLTELCMSFLAVAPILQSSSGEPTRDKQLNELVLECPDDKFLLVGPAYLNQVRRRLLNVNVKVLDEILDKLGDLLRDYTYSQSVQLQLLATNVLSSTSHIWLQKSCAESELGENVRSLCSWISQITETKKVRSWRVRDTISRFFDWYLSQDPSLSFWPKVNHEDDEDEPVASPATILPILGADEDIRVRFRAAVANARLFSIARATGREALNLYEEIRVSLTRDLTNYEQMLTRMLSLGNIMVVSSAVRRGPYWHLLEAAFHSPLYTKHIEAVLSGVSERLGLTRPSQLFEAYASQIAYSIRQALQDVLRLSPQLLGYKDRKQCAEATFRSFTPTNVMAGGPDLQAIAHGQNLFASHCAAIQRPPEEGIRDCIGDLVGFQIVYWLDETMADPETPASELEELLRAKGVMDAEQGALDRCIAHNADGIVTAIIRTLGDQDFSTDGAIVQGLRSAGESNDSINIFHHLARYRHLQDFELHNPNLPTFSTTTVLRALRWCTPRIPSDHAGAASFHALHQLFADVQNTPLVNEQIRLLNGITLLVSARHRDFLNATLLHTFIHGATSLLAQSDLAQTARSFLEWSFSLYRLTTEVDPRFPDILIRVCALAHDYATDVATAELGSDLLHWIDGQALQLCQSPKIKPQVMKALSAWPHQPSSDLLSVYEDITSDKLSTILSDYRITSNKFRLVRRLRDLAEQQAYDRIQFAETDFWRLKDCIPPREQLQPSDIDAFASLLVANLGDIYSFGSEQPFPQTIRARHQRDTKKQDASGTHSSPQRAIVQSLLAMLDGNVPSQVHLAYRTLRFLMAASSSDALLYQSWPPEYRAPLEYLRMYPVVARNRPARRITELQVSESHLETDFAKWISMITTVLADILSTSDPFFAQFATILRFDVVFAEDILPVLVHTLLQFELSQEPSNGRPAHKQLSDYFSAVLQLEGVHLSCLQCIVDVVLHLRTFRPSNTNDGLAHDKWLAVDYHVLAKSAVTCGAYTTALLFLELATEHQAQADDAAGAAEQILFDIYSHIDEPDGFYGITTSDLRQFLIKRFHHEKQWEKAFRFHGAALEAGKPEAIDAEGLLSSFHAFGFDRLAIGTLQSPQIGFDTKTTASGLSYHLGWRTETWDLPENREDSSSGVSLYKALRAIYRERDARTVDGVVRGALYDEMDRLRNLGTENITEIREIARNIMCLNQVAHWRTDHVQQRLINKVVDLHKWSDFLQIDSGFDFSHLEGIIATRISLLRSIRQKEEREQIGTLLSPFVRGLVDLEKSILVRLSQAARESDQLQVALNSIVKAQRLERNPTSEVSQEFANVLWRQNEPKLAVQFLKDVVHRDKRDLQSGDSDVMIQKALSLARLGAWISEACLEKPTDIMSQFFGPATTLAAEVEKRADSLGAACANVYHKCALFAEQQYHSILKSPDAMRWKIYVERKTHEIRRRESQLMKTQQGSSEFNTLSNDQNKAKALLAEDAQSFQRHNGSRDSFLQQALDMYSRCLASCDSFDDDGPIRLCSLWFANFDDERIQDKVRAALSRVPSRKFVFLAHQLSARISKSSSVTSPKNQQNLQALVVRMCQEHPYHSLYQVYCLRPERSSQSSANRRSSARHEPSSSQTDRADAASEIFDRVRNESTCGERVRAVEHICDASLQWAKYPIKDNRSLKKSNGIFHVPDSLLIRQIRDIQVPVITAHTPLDPTLKYDNCVWIAHFEAVFQTAGGINLPKISNCVGSDGKKYKQLFKGEGGDDMRQDAVMEQVFTLVNVVLRCDRETRRRDLKIRGYTVVPLAAQAGVLEFVGNTVPLMNWLNDAHTRYRPNDMEHRQIMNVLKRTREKHQGKVEPLVAMYKEIRKRSQPVMRHYFTEKHKTPIAWFAMRLNYTRSVATTSIVGHILGLGDRHVSNILLDNGSGEVVHIDLGIAFDQGKLLRVPERVPFRMTRDMVDGMGRSGTQGVFQRCAEETLRVLRDRSDVILTVLEVFKYDPLHSWTASELKLKKVQDISNEPTARVTRDTSRFGAIGIDMTSGTADEAADRALTSVARKLDKALSVEYTVNELIAEATDIVNLATIYHGWSPDF